jgi:hypothetical protein
MTAETMICRRCGTLNAAGDQFCGSCGAFLEWDGEAAGPVERVAAPAVATPEPAPLPGPTATPAPAPLPGPAPAPTGLTCSSCGTVNPGGRTFCQSCGTLLGRESVSGPGGGTSLAGDRPKPPAEGGGLPGWLPPIAGLGLLVGIAAVVLLVVMRPAGPESAVSPDASATLTPTLRPSAAASVPSGAASASAAIAESVQLTTTGATASSVVGDRADFAPDKAIDGRLDTCWQEGAEDEPGEWIEITFDASRLDYVVVYAGYQLSHDAYLANRRPENVLVSVNGGPPTAFTLVDAEQPQRLDLDDTDGATSIRLEIVSTFDPVATDYPGSPFDDLAISEIRPFGVAGG